MKNAELLKFVRTQLVHLEDHLMSIDQATSNGKETTYTYPLQSNTGALVLIDMAIQEDVESKLVATLAKVAALNEDHFRDIAGIILEARELTTKP